jgi:hypothetical protein
MKHLFSSKNLVPASTRNIKCLKIYKKPVTLFLIKYTYRKHVLNDWQKFSFYEAQKQSASVKGLSELRVIFASTHESV